jgi:transcriptional regulator with XRE-family HTH domain
MSAPIATFSGATAWQLRLAQQRSRRNVAVPAAISVDHLKALERGTAQPSVGCLTRLAAALGVPISDLFDSESAGA